MLRKSIDFLGITLGALIFALGTQAFIVAVQLGGGGVSGLALLAYYIWKFPIGLATILLNIPLLLLGWREIGKGFILRTTFAVAAISVFLELFRGLSLVPAHDLLLGGLYGGVAQGIGVALILRFEGSTGGVDIVAKVLNRYYGHSMGNVMLVANVIVILLSWAVLGGVIAMYTLVSQFVSSKVLDSILEGVPAKSAMIISEHGKEIAEKIIRESPRGVTILRGTGAYTKNEKDVLLCVLALSELVRLKRLVKEVDPNAFIIISDAKEVLGQGFEQLA